MSEETLLAATRELVDAVYGQRAVMAAAVPKCRGRLARAMDGARAAIREAEGGNPPLCGDATCESPMCRQSAIDAYYAAQDQATREALVALVAASRLPLTIPRKCAESDE